MSNFRVTVNLSNFFHDHRSRARIFISDDIQTISDLENRVEKIFGINNFHLTSQNEYLPALEDVRILQKDDIVWIIPNNEGNELRDTSNISSKKSYQSTQTDSKKRSISLIDDYGEEELSCPKKKKKKKHNPGNVSEDVPLNEVPKRKRKNKKAGINSQEVIKNVPMETKTIASKNKKHKKRVDDNPNTDNNVIKMNTLLPVLQSHISTYNKKINGNVNKTNASLSTHSEVPSSTVTNENDCDNDSDEIQDFKKEKYSCKGNLASYKKNLSLPTITNQYLQQKKVNIVKIECLAGASQLNKLEHNNHVVGSENKNNIQGNDDTQNSIAEENQNNPFDESVKNKSVSEIGTGLSPSTSVHVQKAPVIMESIKDQTKTINTESSSKIQRIESTLTSGIEQLLSDHHKTIEIGDAVPINKLSTHKLNDLLCSQNETNSPKDAINKNVLSNANTCSPTLNEKDNNSVLNVGNDQELSEIIVEAEVVNAYPNTSDTVTSTQKVLSKESDLLCQQKYFTFSSKDCDYKKSSESLCVSKKPDLPYQQKYFTYNGKLSDYRSDKSLRIFSKPDANKELHKFVTNYENKNDKSLSDQNQIRETILHGVNSQTKYIKPQQSVTECEHKIDESLTDNTNGNELKEMNSENSQMYESSIKYSEQQPQVTTENESRINEYLPNDNLIQSRKTDLKEANGKPNIIYMHNVVTVDTHKENKHLSDGSNHSQITKTNMDKTNNQLYETSMKINQNLDRKINSTSYIDTAGMFDKIANDGFIETKTDIIPKLHKNEVNLNDNVIRNVPATAKEESCQNTQAGMEVSEIPLLNNDQRDSVTSEMDITKDVSDNLDRSSILTTAEKESDQCIQACMEVSDIPLLSDHRRNSVTSELDITKDISDNLDRSSIVSRISSITPSRHFQRKSQSGIGHLLQELRSNESLMSLESPDTDCSEFITKRQRKRVRKRRKRANASINSDTSLNDSSLIVTEAYVPKPMKVKACRPSIHIKFEEDENGENVKVIDLVKPTDNKSYPEESFENITIDSDLDESNLGKFKIEEQDILKSPSMSKMLPKIGDFIAFKVLRITEFYTPELSTYIVGKVLQFHGDSTQVIFEILSGLDQCEEPKGKLSMDIFAHNNRTANNQRTFAWVDLVDPRLLFP